MYNTITRTPAHLLAVALIALGAATATTAQAQALSTRINTRPLTPQEITDYGLPSSTETASGLTTIGKGQPAYLEALVSSSIAPSNIVSVTWDLVGKPVGSAAVLGASPLGANVPIYIRLEREEMQVAGPDGRALLRPDLVGQYTVAAAIATTTTNYNVTNTITAGTYLGAEACAFCHSATPGIPATYNTFTNTPHATAFARKIDDSTGHFGANCVSCHVLGYDTNTNAVNGGWDDVALATGWVLPSVLTNGNYAAMPAKLRNVSNIQCESCHGAGSEHAYTALMSPEDHQLIKDAISVSYNPGDCAQCHDKPTHHFKSAEWNNSGHAVSPVETSASCSRCHTPQGFANFVEGRPAVSVEYEPIGCAGCHDPHDASQPHQLRVTPDVTLSDKVTVITNGGAGKLCMECHIGRQNAATYVETTSGSSRFGPHHGPQTDMLVGANAVTYGKEIPSAAHRDAVTNSCVTCHMQDIESGPAFLHAGGHTFNVSYLDSSSNKVDLVEACTQCHGPITSFDFKRQDYDGDGVVDGVQTEVKHLLDQVGMLLPPIGSPTVTISSSYTKPQLKAAFNYQFVLEDGSYGVHNVSYAVGLLKASIADLTDDSDHDGLSDKWEIAKFGSLIYDGNSDNDGDGVSNALEIAAGTNPLLADSDSDGISDFAELQAGSDPLNPSDKPGFVVQIYTAAEVEFNSEVGLKYQVQKVSDMTGTWMNVGSVTNGTGNVISMPVSTRHGGPQNFFRVKQVP